MRGVVGETTAAFNTAENIRSLQSRSGEFQPGTVAISRVTEDFPVVSQPDVMFRMIENLFHNSAKEANLIRKDIDSEFMGEVTVEAEKRPDTTVLTISDNGRGMGKYFKTIGLETDEENIPIPIINEHRNDAIKKGRIAKSKNGNGLKIIGHLGELGNTKGFFKNPKMTEGTVVELHFSIA